MSGIKDSLYRRLKSWQLLYKLFKVRNKKKKVVLGSGGLYQEGWIPTGIETIDVRNEHKWSRFFKPGTIDVFLAEHIWEHLTEDEAKKSAELCFKYLKPGGYCRIAVPDGYHPDPNYQKGVGPIGPDKEHKVLYTYQTLPAVFESAGFEVKLLEYYDEKSNFVFNEWSSEDGLINRSKRYRGINKDASCLGLENYTSLIIDAIKA